MTAAEYLRNRKYVEPKPVVYDDGEVGVIDVCWNIDSGTWAIIEAGYNIDSDFSFCARGPGGKIKMQGTATVENLAVVIDFATALMSD